MYFAAAFAALLSATTVMGGVIPPRPGRLLLGPSNRKTQNSIKTSAASSDEGSDDHEYIWVGGVIDAPPLNDRFTSVSAKIIAPNPRVPPGGQAGTDYGAAAWLGIDGYNNLFILQVGFLFHINPQGVARYDACYQWYPGIPECQFIKDFRINTGDVIFMSVESPDGETGTVIINNESTNQNFKLPLTVPADSVLPGQNAEWIVEEYQYTGKAPTPPPDFGYLEFTEATATTSNGRSLSPADGMLVDWAPKLSGAIGPGKVTVTFTGGEIDCGAEGQSDGCLGPGYSGDSGNSGNSGG